MIKTTERKQPIYTVSSNVYKHISLILWGCIPVDKEWAINTNLFKEKLKEVASFNNFFGLG